MSTMQGEPTVPSTTRLTIYSVMADCPQYRIARLYDGIEDPQPTWTGDAPVADLEGVFRCFNRAFEEDAERLEALGSHLPSLSVGDVVIIGNDYHIVASVGFAEITEEDYATIVGASHDERHRVAWRIAREAAIGL